MLEIGAVLAQLERLTGAHMSEPAATPAERKTTEHRLYTSAEAVAVIKAAPKGSTFSVWVDNHTPRVDEAGVVVGEENGAFRGIVTIPRAQAASIANHFLRGPAEARGARIPVTISYNHDGSAAYMLG
jgi:hypothetical protein